MEEKFIGVYPLDRIPNHFKEGGYVINSQTRDLPGEHWIAIYVGRNQIKVFDPFGFYYPSSLVRKVIVQSNKPVYFNYERTQNYATTNCGQLCLLWLTLQNLTFDI